MGKPPVGAGTFCPSPMLVFYIPSGRHQQGAFQFPERNFPAESVIFYFIFYLFIYLFILFFILFYFILFFVPILSASIQGNHGLVWGLGQEQYSE
jgi:hypothetical protein